MQSSSPDKREKKEQGDGTCSNNRPAATGLTASPETGDHGAVAAAAVAVDDDDGGGPAANTNIATTTTTYLFQSPLFVPHKCFLYTFYFQYLNLSIGGR